MLIITAKCCFNFFPSSSYLSFRRYCWALRVSVEHNKRMLLCNVVYKHFWATVCENGSPCAIGPLSVLSVLSVSLSVTLVYCGQTVGWIKMKFGMEVSLGPGPHCVDGDPAPPEKGVQPLILGPCLLQLNGWMDQDATWYAGRPRPRPQCISKIVILNF